jgi:hypothetical protein
MLTNLLIVIEQRGYLKLVRNEKGEATGGRAYEIKAETGVLAVAGVEAQVIPRSGVGESTLTNGRGLIKSNWS